MFRLREQVRRHEIWRGAAVGDHQHFRRAGRHINCRAVETLADLAFRLGDKRVAGAKNFVHFWHGFAAERQSGNGLGTADVEDFLHAAQLRSVKDFIRDRRW